MVPVLFSNFTKLYLRLTVVPLINSFTFLFSIIGSFLESNLSVIYLVLCLDADSIFAPPNITDESPFALVPLPIAIAPSLPLASA